MQIKIVADRRPPMCELEHTVETPIDTNLARMVVADMHMTQDDNGICFTGRFTNGDITGARIDIFAKGKQAYARFAPYFQDQFENWIRTELSQPMLVQLPTGGHVRVI